MLEEKVEALTTEVVALRKVMEKVLANGGTGTAAATEDKAAAKSGTKAKPAAKPKKVEPKHDADEVAAIMRKAAKDVDKAKIQEYIAEQSCADLAELLTKPELFDAAYDFAAEMLGEGEEEEADDEDI